MIYWFPYNTKCIKNNIINIYIVYTFDLNWFMGYGTQWLHQRRLTGNTPHEKIRKSNKHVIALILCVWVCEKGYVCVFVCLCMLMCVHACVCVKWVNRGGMAIIQSTFQKYHKYNRKWIPGCNLLWNVGNHMIEFPTGIFCRWVYYKHFHTIN